MTRPPIRVEMTVNERRVGAWMPAHTTLLTALRDHFSATDVKYGCGEGVCGTCTVLVDDEPVNACLVFAVQVADRDVRTMSGLSSDDDLHPLQACFLKHGGAQCGFCTPGMVVTALAHAESGGSADRDDIRAALSGNICRCTGYVKIIDAVEDFMVGTATAPSARAVPAVDADVEGVA